ncbi:MAG: filamentous hemagglutinin N-terminal domain-containing protein, partial [Burkholderiales bacterium]|nr:filamentous hemagglutinin N-terminal domain-containing protein [Burkholderiales bacterium]
MSKHASMNRVFRLVWSHATQSWAVVSEHTKGKGKTSGRAKLLLNLPSVMLGLAAFPGLAQPPTNQLPTNPQLIAGQATVSQSNADMLVQQASQRAVMNWDSFNVGRDAKVTFQQPSSSAAILNRVVGSDTSQIFGQINANGQVFLMNPSGVFFSPTASVNVGSLVATTHNISVDDFMQGKMRFDRNGATGGLINEGNITAALGGYVALLAPEVRNNGVIIATQGTVALAAGESITLNFASEGALVGVTVSKSTIAALVENKKAVLAPEGIIILSAQAAEQLRGGVVNNSGQLAATGIVNRGGKIILEASDAISHSGSIDVSAAANSAANGGTVSVIADLSNSNSHTSFSGSIKAQAGNAGGNGGMVETSGSHLTITDSARVNTLAAKGFAGTWLLDPTDFTVAASGGDMTGAALSANLVNGSVAIQTADGSGTSNFTFNGSRSGTGNITINDNVSWSANQLTLNAHKDIVINNTMNGSGSASLVLLYGQGAIDGVIGGVESNYYVNAPVNLPATNISSLTPFKFETQLGTSGPVISYTVINSLGSEGSTTGKDLQGMNAANGQTNFAIGANIDASDTANWSGGFSPINTLNSSVVFNGLGHTINNLSIQRPDQNEIGLFSFNYGTIRNIGLVNISVAGNSYVGGLVGKNLGGNISNSYATGNIIAGATTTVGGLVGAHYGGSISNSYATGNIIAGDNAHIV